MSKSDLYRESQQDGAPTDAEYAAMMQADHDSATAVKAQAEAQEDVNATAELAEMLAVVIQAGPTKWQHTEAMTADEHGAAFTQMIRDTAERHELGDEPRPVHWLSVNGDLSLAFVGSSPNSPHLARALCGAWNRLVEDAPVMLAALATQEAHREP